MSLFGKKRNPGSARLADLTPVETEIFSLYSQLWTATGMPYDEAKSFAEESILKAIDESRADGMYELPTNLGDLVLANKSSTDSMTNQWIATLQRRMAMKRADGMTDGDFREYWNEPEVARRMSVVAMNVNRMAMFTQVLETGGPWESMDEASQTAARVVKSRHATFAHPRESDDPNDLDRPLPFEAQSNVTRLLNVFQADAENLMAQLDQAGTVNAYYRKSLNK